MIERTCKTDICATRSIRWETISFPTEHSVTIVATTNVLKVVAPGVVRALNNSGTT